jgi:hypothetical protein
MEAVAGVTTNEIEVAAVTVKVAVAVLPYHWAVMVDWPMTLPEARPVAEIVATPGPPTRSVEVQAEAAVTSLEDPSLKVALAVNCWVPVIGIEAVAGVTVRETRAVTPVPKIGSRPPHPAARTTSSMPMNLTKILG